MAANVAALGGTPGDTAALVQTYLYDLLPEDFRGIVEIRAFGAREHGQREVPSKGLPKDFAAELKDLLPVVRVQREGAPAHGRMDRDDAGYEGLMRPAASRRP